MNYVEKAVVCVAISRLRGEAWRCICLSCTRARKEGVQLESLITDRVMLTALIVAIGEDDCVAASSRVNRMDAGMLIDQFEKKRKRFDKQMESECISAQNATQEPEEKPGSGRGRAGKTKSTGGGVRVIRGTKSLS